MTRRRITGISDVAELQLCTGCGACAFAQPAAIRMVDDLDAGRRPVVGEGEDGRLLPTVDALAACPGHELSHRRKPQPGPGGLSPAWGPVLEVWEGYASDPDVRFAGSSGGLASALALHAIEQQHRHGVLHIRARDDAPYLNETTLSTTRDEVLAATGSRYAPASPCDRLDLIEDAPAPCVFVGKPCDVAAVEKLRASRPTLDANLGLTVAIFCAGTPTTRGTLEMLERMGIDDPDGIESLRYRGNGWPGKAVATIKTPGGEIEERELSYDGSWGEVLQRHRQWRCYVCPDHTGEFADIAVGDPWYREISDDEPGLSLVLVRTVRGREALKEAMSSGAVEAWPAAPSILPESQPGLLRVRGAVGGRVAILRILRVPTPRFSNLPMLRVWITRLSLRAKFQSTIGTLKRIRRRGLYARHPVNAFRDPPMGHQDN